MFCHFVKSAVFLSSIPLAPSSAQLLSISAVLPSPTCKLSKKSTSAGPRNLIFLLLSRLVSAVFPSPRNSHRLRITWPGWGQHNLLKMLSQLFSDMNVLSNKIKVLEKCFWGLKPLSGEMWALSSLRSIDWYFQIEMNKIIYLSLTLKSGFNSFHCSSVLKKFSTFYRVNTCSKCVYTHAYM